MSIQGPSSLPLRPYAPPALAGTAAPRAAAAPAARTAVQAPAESSLWELLTGEERAFFSQQASMGALTYGRSRGTSAATPASTAPIGQRLDVKG